MFFPLLSNVFTNILKIYELPKIYNKIPKYCQTLALTIIIYQIPSKFIWLLNYIPMNFIENLALPAKDSFDSKFLKEILGRIFFLKNVVPKESFVCCIGCCLYSLQ